MKEDKSTQLLLKESLLKLDKHQLKLFYGVLVHYWASHNFFISKRNLFNLWCESNYLCAEVDESFPEPYYDHNLLKSFCPKHPYYFIDILGPELIVNLFSQHLDDRLDLLIDIVRTIHTDGLRGAYECSNKALGLSENIAELVACKDCKARSYADR